MTRMGSLITLMAATSLFAQHDPNQSHDHDATVSGPKLVVQQRMIDLGPIKPDDTRTATFVLRNLGDEALVLAGVHKGDQEAGEDLPEYKGAVILPGESLDISVPFLMTQRSGRQTESVFVRSNDIHEPQVQLLMTAEAHTVYQLWAQGRLNPTDLRFRQVVRDTAIPDPIDVLPGDPGAKLEIQELTLTTPVLSYQTDPLVSEGRGGIRITLWTDGEDPVGPVDASLKIGMNIDGEPYKAEIGLVGEVVGDLAYRPPEIKLWRPMPAGSSLIRASVASRSKTPFDILRVEAGPQITVEVSPQRSNEHYSLAVIINKDAPEGPFATTLDIYTSLPEQPLIRIPLWAQVAPVVWVNPPAVLLRYHGNEKPPSRRVKLHPFLPTAPLQIIDVSTDTPYIAAEVISDIQRARPNVYYVRVSAAPDAPVGTHSANVRIKTSLPEVPQMSIPVTLIRTE